MINLVAFLSILSSTFIGVSQQFECQYDGDIIDKQQAIFDEALSQPLVTQQEAIFFDEVDFDDYDYFHRSFYPDPLDLNSASVNYFYFGGDRSSTLLLGIMGSKHNHYDPHSRTARTKFVSRFLWRETADHLFENITDKVCFDKHDILWQKIQPSDPVARETSLLLLFQDQSERYYISITSDSGRTFKKNYVGSTVEEKLQKYTFYSSMEKMQPSPSNVNRILAADLFLSLDGGVTWNELINKRYYPKYEGKPHKAMWVNSSMILTSTQTRDGISLHRCSIQGQKHRCEILLTDIKNFVRNGNVVIASIYHANDAAKNRSLYTSTDLGQIWNRAQVPIFEGHHKPYVYLLSDKLSFLTLIDEDESCYDLYVSDSQHVSYSLSLKCLYEQRTPVGRFGVEKLGDLENAYVVNKIEEPGKPPRMMVTLNNGGHWKRADVSNTTCVNCFLNIDREMEGSYGFDYVKEPDEPLAEDIRSSSFYHVGAMLSSEFVPGFALSYIQSSDHLGPGFPFATVDGGNSFFPIPNMDSYRFAFMASGDILVDYSTDTAPALSFDRGHCWYNYSLGSFPNNHRIILTVDPRNKVSDLAELLVFTPVENSFLSMVRPSVTFLDPLAKRVAPYFEIKSYKIDLGKIAKSVPTCDSSGTNVEQQETCVLGIKKMYKRPKPGVSTCKLHQQDLETVDEHCPCDDEDYECDFGFQRISEEGEPLQCGVLGKEDLDKISVCYYKLYKNHDKFYSTTGYRKVANDNCTGGKSKQFEDKPEHEFKLICTKDDYIIGEYLSYTEPDYVSGSSSVLSIFMTTLLITVLLVLAIFAALFVYKRRAQIPSFTLPSFSSIRNANFNFARFQDEV